MTVFDGIPAELSAHDHWICWRNECRHCGAVIEPTIKECPDCVNDSGDPIPTTKRPVNPSNGRLANAADPSTWGDIESARNHYQRSDCHGIGFVFSNPPDEDSDEYESLEPDDQDLADARRENANEIFGVDIDDCRDPETGEVGDDALDIVATLHSFTEVSPSGTGLHVYGYGEKPAGASRKDGVEIYDDTRYFTVTGDHFKRSPSDLNYRQDELAEIHGGYVDSSESGRSTTVDVSVDLSGVDFREPKDKYENDLGETLAEARDQDDELDAALTDLQPGYELPNDQTTSEYDLSAVSKLWKRRFSIDDIARILYEYRYRDKVERQDYLELTIEAGAGGERFDPRGSEDVSILDDRERYTSIEDARLPTTDNFVLDKPPREGGSHASIDHLSHKPLVILASRHSICEHHLEILEKVMPDGKTAVHYEGSARACRHGGDDDCPNVVGGENYEDLYRVIHEAKDAIAKNRIITKDDTPEDLCPSQFLKHCEEHAWAVVTVPNLLPNLERNIGGCNLLIDEEQALSYFRPPSVTLANIETVYDPDGSRRVQASSSNITTQLSTLREICQQIMDDRAQRSKGGKTDRIQRLDHEEDILHATDYLKRVAATMSIEDITDEIGGSPTAGEVVSEIRDRLDGIPVPTPAQSPSDFRDGIEEHVERYYFDDSVDPGAMVECVMFGYDERKFDFKNTPGGYKLRMIGGRDVLHESELQQFEQIGVIAGPEGELLFEDMDGADATVIEITDFVYSDDFVICPLGKEMGERMEPVGDQRRRARRVSKILNRRAHPHLAITGTKDRAKAHHGNLVEGIAEIISSPESPALDIDATWTTGGTAVIYENSAVSRGIDAPQIDISVVVSSGFATPHWEARKKHYQGEDDEKHEYARSIEAQLKNHELTNAVLRPSPTRYVDDITGTKFIVCADWDVPRIRYLDQETPAFANATSAANFLEQLTVEGGIRREQELVYEQVGSEREYIETTMSSEFKERINDRPSYAIDELETWANNRYLTREGTVEKIEKAIPPRSEIDLSYLTGLYTGWNKSRISASLKVLERKGIIESYQEDDDSRGKPKTLWKKPSFKSEDG